MAAGRTLKSLVSRRRRVGHEEDEEEDGPVLVEDSQSEGSLLSDAEEEEDEEGHVVGDGVDGPAGADADPARYRDPLISPTTADEPGRKQARKVKPKVGQKGRPSNETSEGRQPAFVATPDSEAMKNGLKIRESQSHSQDRGNEESAESTAHDFEDMAQVKVLPGPSTINGHPASVVERQRREHEEYRKKRDSDPAFIPNRGNFFMHDTRGQLNGQGPAPQRGSWVARGRGRGGPNVGGPFPPANQFAQAERAAEQLWKHDLHDTINEEPPPKTGPAVPPPTQVQDKGPGGPQEQKDSLSVFAKPSASGHAVQLRALSFSSTTLVGKVQIRVSLPGQKTPTSFSDVPWKHYIRLPDHRPPLRRDKPVRVSIPEHTQRYIFPAPDRSFVFIPRQMRPNQRGYGHNAYQRSIGGFGGSSRRTSMYGGSIYSASAAASRRSSLAGISRDNAFSPVGSFVGMPPSRPVVRLPHNAAGYSASSTPLAPLSGQHTPTGMPQIHTYPLPQQPIHQGTPTTTMHQPRPQKAISVTGIESPAALQTAPTESQPFQNQLPAHMTEHAAYVPQQQQQQPLPPPYFSPRQQYPQPQPHAQIGTPLSGIPEQAIHAVPFQPPTFGQHPAFYPPYAPQQQQPLFYPPGGGFASMPVYMLPSQGYAQVPPPQQQSLPMPQPQPPSHLQQPPQLPPGDPTAAASGMVAHESNGMVFYVPASEAVTSQQNFDGAYQPAEGFVPSYAMPGLPPPTPVPENQMSYYYPPMQVQQVEGGAYYGAQQPQM